MYMYSYLARGTLQALLQLCEMNNKLGFLILNQVAHSTRNFHVPLTAYTFRCCVYPSVGVLYMTYLHSHPRIPWEVR